MSDKSSGRLKELSTQILGRGFRLTGARKSVLASLVNCDGHVTADQLAELVNAEDRRVGRMTVYRTLDLLLKLGLIRRTYQGSGAAHYVLMDEGHHHHLICSECDRIIEFDVCTLPELGGALSREYNFEIEGHLLEVYGRCQDCQER
jgi:Fur family transcriptional regulator, ferric uptake regulator